MLVVADINQEHIHFLIIFNGEAFNYRKIVNIFNNVVEM